MVLPGLDIDLAALDIATDASSRRSSILSPHSQRTSLSSQQTSDESAIGLVIPSSDGGGAGDMGGFVLPSSELASVQGHVGMSGFLGEAEDDFNLDPGFMFDNDGNMVDTGEVEFPPQDRPVVPAAGRVRADSGASSHVRRELQEAVQAGQAEVGDYMDLDLNVPRPDDEDLILPQAEAFPAIRQQPLAGAVPQEESSSEAGVARQQRKRREPKLLPIDQTQELRNTDLAEWNNNYVANMDHAKKIKTQHKLTSTAKQNAAAWVFGAGIGGIGAGVNALNVKGPLAEMFAGEAFVQALTGVPTQVAGLKRGSEELEAAESESEARRVRMRQGDEELGLAQGLNLEDDDGIVLPGSEAIEMARHAQPALDDTSQFPWNRSASLRGSRQGSIGQGFGSSVGGFATSGGRLSSLPPIAGPGSLDRRASRITSTSPLVGRGQGQDLEPEISQFDDNELLGGPSTSVAGDDFQIYGPAAIVDTQTAAQSQWLRAALDTESSNFLEFIKAEVSSKAAAAQDTEDQNVGGVVAPTSVFFEELLPPDRNTKIVGAQALLHVLALATKGLIHVKQEEHYGPINLSPAAGL
ncbi:MAG: hypothetical protein Q9207_000743 [Kuettlingeria erythrocarpa]